MYVGRGYFGLVNCVEGVVELGFDKIWMLEKFSVDCVLRFSIWVNCVLRVNFIGRGGGRGIWISFFSICIIMGIDGFVSMFFCVYKIVGKFFYFLDVGWCILKLSWLLRDG